MSAAGATERFGAAIPERGIAADWRALSVGQAGRGARCPRCGHMGHSGARGSRPGWDPPPCREDAGL